MSYLVRLFKGEYAPCKIHSLLIEWSKPKGPCPAELFHYCLFIPRTYYPFYHILESFSLHFSASNTIPPHNLQHASLYARDLCPSRRHARHCYPLGRQLGAGRRRYLLRPWGLVQRRTTHIVLRPQLRRGLPQRHPGRGRQAVLYRLGPLARPLH